MENFAEMLRPDPSVALGPPQNAVAMRRGPLPKVQFVVELVGPRSVPAAYARHLLAPNWYDALGKPGLWCMAASDEAWRPLPDAEDGSYDSLALAWDLFKNGVGLNATAATTLLARAEEFATHIQRRAMPMPIPQEVERLAMSALQTRDSLDIGLSLVFVPRTGNVLEKDLWIQCARMGLTFADGAFHYLAHDNPLPLLSVTPIGEDDFFNLGAVQAGVQHDAATIGFSIPLCPSPAEALDACFHVGRTLVQELGGWLVDEEGQQADHRTQSRLQAELQQARRLFQDAGIEPGSATAEALWSI